MTSNSTDRDLNLGGVHIGESVDHLRADIAALSETVTRLVSEGAASARSQIKDSTGRVARGTSAASQQIYHEAAALGRDAADTAHDATEQIETRIARNPIATALVALGLGFAIGIMSRR